MGTFLVNKVLWKSKFSNVLINKSWSPNQIFFTDFFFGKDLTNFRHWKLTFKLRILRSLTRLFIILVSLMRSLYSEKCLFPKGALVVWCPTWSKNLGRSLIWLSYDCWVLILLRGWGMYSTVYYRAIILYLSPFFFLVDWVALASTKFCCKFFLTIKKIKIK